jgi:penicillin-binding protein 1A
LGIVHRTNEFLLKSPYFTEHIRRHLVDRYGFERVYNEGLIVHSTCDLALQKTAQEAVSSGVEGMDRSFGWRGPLLSLPLEEIDAFRTEKDDQYRAEAAKRLDPTGQTPPESALVLEEGRQYEGVVNAVAKKHAIVDVGEALAIIPLSKTRWGFKPDVKRSWRYRQLNDLQRMLKVGDVIQLEISKADWRETEAFAEYSAAGEGPYAAAIIRQPTQLQGALLSYNVEDGAVRAMVGGRDFENSEFNRAIQAKRQVGSTFKPLVYTTAINTRKFTAGSMILDAPLTKTTVTEDLWKPGNYGNEYEGQLSLRRAICKSKNVCTVRVLEAVGIGPVYEFARKLRIESDMELIDPKCNARKLPCMGLSAGLGAGSTTMLELARAYSVFPTQGHIVEPYFIDKVLDRDGAVLEEYVVPEAPRVLEASVAGIGTWLLHQVATAGTGAATNRLGLTLGGKTGTTNDHRDGWFMGFSRDVVTAVWVGYDQPRPMGVSSTGGRVALPIWMDYMAAAVPKKMNRPFEPIPNVTWVPIDETTGRMVVGGRMMPYLPETVPSYRAIEVGQVTEEDLLTQDF